MKSRDLMASVAKLVSISEMKGESYDHIVVECSGIAEPRKIRDLFQEAEDYNSYLVANVQLDTLLTVVDASVFFNMYGSADQDFHTNEELAVREGDEEGQTARVGRIIIPMTEVAQRNDAKDMVLDGDEEEKHTKRHSVVHDCSTVQLLQRVGY